MKIAWKIFKWSCKWRKNINEEIFKSSIKYQNPLPLIKDLFKAEKNKNDKVKYQIITELIKLMEDIDIKEIPGNKNPKKVVNIIGKILDFNEQQKGKEIKILTSIQILKRLPIALAKVKASNTSENLLSEIRQTIYSLYQEKEVTKKVYNNIMNSIKWKSRMNTIFMNSKNSKTFDLHRLLCNLTDKINLKTSDEYAALSNLSIYYAWKI